MRMENIRRARNVVAAIFIQPHGWDIGYLGSHDQAGIFTDRLVDVVSNHAPPHPASLHIVCNADQIDYSRMIGGFQ